MTSLVAILLFASSAALAQTPSPLQVELELFTSQVNNPVAIVNAGDDRLFVVEQNSADIEIFDLSGNYIGKFIDLSSEVNANGNEQGLLGLAFHPDYANNGKFYVNYTAGSSSGSTHISEFSVSANPDIADASSEVVLMDINQDFSNHNGGTIAFGPDGHLYIGMGDGGSGGDPNNRAQAANSLLGKMLRIQVPGNGTYSIPADNPYVGSAGILDEIWAFGVRNPWKFSFDALTGDMWIADVGQNAWEEIDFQPASSPGGENWGWRCYEGNASYNTSGCQPQNSYESPIAVQPHNQGWCSITGGVVYRGSEFEDMFGRYFYTDYCLGGVYSIHDEGGSWVEEQPNTDGTFGYATFGEDSNGEVYLGDISTDAIYRLVDPCDSFTPSIELVGDQLQSTAGDDYYWYQDDVLIAGINAQTLDLSGLGEYYAVVDNGDGCAKATNELTVNFCTPGLPGCTYPNAENYNPEATEDDGSCIIPIVNDCPSDLNGDQLVNTDDLLNFLAAFGQPC